MLADNQYLSFLAVHTGLVKWAMLILKMSQQKAVTDSSQIK
jgi:hypothetical protein